MIGNWFEQINNSIPIRLCTTFLLIFTINFCFAQSASIEIDGVFNDWHETLTTEKDPSESISGIDLLSLSLTNDRDYLFIRLKVRSMSLLIIIGFKLVKILILQLL